MSTLKRALFRCDASPMLGGGHVMRCLALAHALAKIGFDMRFACVSGTMDSVPALGRSGISIIELKDPRESAELLSHLDEPVEVAVFDHYGLDARYEKALRPMARRIVAIDDLADRPHDCDLLVDPTFGRGTVEYLDLVPANARVLAGAQYALLRPEFAATRPAALARRAGNQRIEHILISMGMTDIGGITATVLEAVLAAQTGAAIDVVIGSAAPSLDSLRRIAAEHDEVTLHIDTADMCTLMTKADLGLGAAGSTSWERCCLGLPSIVVVLADNQREIAQALGTADILTNVDTAREIKLALAAFTREPERLVSMSRLAAAVSDGGGVTRIADFLRDSDHRRGHVQEAQLRPATMADAETLWKWRNEPTARAASRNSEPVAWGSHVEWLSRRLQDDDTMLRIIEFRGVPAGMIRLDRRPNGSAAISINVDGRMRARGIGRQLLEKGCKEAASGSFCSRFTAEVRVLNHASLRLFSACGFDIVGFDEDMAYLTRDTEAPP